MTGRLSVVATPIGNLEDITLRGIRVLREASTVLAEDTRRTRVLLEAHQIGTRLQSLHEHSTEAQIERFVEELKTGAHLALVSDAGTPLVSDPGAELVKRAIEEGVRVEPIPGASAVLSSIAAAGIACETFAFWGFLPRKGEARRESLDRIRLASDAVILFESPKRLKETLADLAEAVGTRTVAVCRELTKMHEEIRRGTAAELLASTPHEVLGEVTIVIERAAPSVAVVGAPPWTKSFIGLLLEENVRTKTIADAIALASDVAKSDAYALVLHEKQSRES